MLIGGVVGRLVVWPYKRGGGGSRLGTLKDFGRSWECQYERQGIMRMSPWTDLPSAASSTGSPAGGCTHAACRHSHTVTVTVTQSHKSQSHSHSHSHSNIVTQSDSHSHAVTQVKLQTVIPG